MNISIHSITVRSLVSASPFLLLHNTRLSLEASTFRSIIPSIVKSDSSVFLHSCNFYRALSSPIRVEQIDNTIDFQFRNRNVITDRVIISAQFCHFIDCASDDRGGAMYISHAYCILRIYDATFTNCTSKLTNGGIYYKGRIFIGKGLCFDGCAGFSRVIHISQGYWFNCKQGQINTLNQTSVVHCGCNPNPGIDNPGVQWSGKIISNSINSSSNAVEQNQAGLCYGFVENPTRLRFITLSNNLGETILHLHGFRMADEIDYIQVINNTAPRGLIFVINSKCLMTYTVFESNTGNLCNVEEGSELHLMGSVFDKEYPIGNSTVDLQGSFLNGFTSHHIVHINCYLNS